jgi:hypothetical protein
MKPRLAVLVVLCPSLATPSFAHGLDEYLQATKVGVGTVGSCCGFA